MSKFVSVIVVLVLLLLATACGPAQESGGGGTGGSAQTPPSLEKIELGVGYIPNVQFAPIYVAQEKGFYAEAGLEVELKYGFETDFVALTAQADQGFAVASGDQVILARAQGLPVVYVLEWYEGYPIAVMALAETGIDSAADLEGHSVGISMLSGASYVGWKALSYGAGLDEDRIDLEVIGFTQSEAVSQGRVDAAVVYVANDPVRLSQMGMDVTVIPVTDYTSLISNGIITNEKVLRENPDLVRRLVQATRRGIAYAIDHPEEAFAISREMIPEMTDEDAPVQRAVLDASVALWRSQQLGHSDPQAWADSVTFMRETGLIEVDLDPETMYTNEFLE